MAENPDGTLRVHHNSTIDKEWIRPRRSHIQDVHHDQVIYD
jgi:hypothetical protein